LPKVSIITAAYNHKEFVRSSVESALNQTYRDFEHIVVDDGSSDGTAEVLQSFGNRIKYIRQENRGTAAAINAGIRASAGEYIAILDSDDAWLPQKLERQMPVFDQFPDTAVVYSHAYVIDGEGKVKEGDLLGQPFSSDGAFADFLRYDPIPVLTAVVRKDCVDKLGGFNERLSAISDWDLWVRISARWPIAFVPEPLALYRIHGRNAHLTLIENGHVDRERLRMLRDAPAWLSGNALEIERKKARLNAMFSHVVLQQSYGFLCRSQYSKTMTYLAFAFKLRPALLKDVPAALRLNPQMLTIRKSFRVMRNLIRRPHES
jgi:glycosyltransferase involved in cell wall biosynthesis